VAQVIDAALLKPARARSTGRYVIVWVIVLCANASVGLTVQALWAESYVLPSGSMIPTLLVGDRFVVDKTARHPGRGDVIAFDKPDEPGKVLVKRVVAVGGDTVEIQDQFLYINGRPVARQHVDAHYEYGDFREDLDSWEMRRGDVWEETLDGHAYRVLFESDRTERSSSRITIPVGNYFVLGDNRDNSNDSRYWGFLPQGKVLGVVRQIWWSYGRPEGIRWKRLGMSVH
jgi:signal peptidase I